ncbi:type II toxin-antitoxin system VapC family toxin [Microbacterium sp. JB110]|uniref:type II toxin-antitoxin system VapC family toxin n=1 Tax=Microbacterium sp. JB110 TaxID=2024477 RepID=UPI00097ECAF5|nr:type II toxin-antitoxin system VapC family toxin [Microbacterium sp. JB110]RCS62860.1 type II toxin-antitoxin system VapC family toxin [Microbacterium sp. JB110]SJM62002.1 hypothetical protein CZ774_11030 [Frigoribacterium sp. JB110]
MILLLNTHLLLWAAYEPDKLSADAVATIEDRANTLLFSAASIWEIAIESGLGRDDFRVDAHVVRRGLLEAGYEELAVSGVHGAAVAELPAVHRDPFDRILVAQARQEGAILLTADSAVAAYGPPTRLI